MATEDQKWIRIGEPVAVEMGESITAGLAVTAGNRDGSRHQEARFDEVELE